MFTFREILLDNQRQRIFPKRWEVSLNRFVFSIGLNPKRQIEIIRGLQSLTGAQARPTGLGS
jgi:hypothetical protein